MFAMGASSQIIAIVCLISLARSDCLLILQKEDGSGLIDILNQESAIRTLGYGYSR